MAPDGFTRFHRHLVVSLWSAPEWAPAASVVDQQFIQLATARVPFRSCKHVPLIAVVNVKKHVSAILTVVVKSFPCHSSWARAFLPAPCHTPSSSGARRTRTVQLLSGLILARCLTGPQSPSMSCLARIPEFRGARRQLALWCLTSRVSRTGYHQRQACKIHSDDVRCVTILLA